MDDSDIPFGLEPEAKAPKPVPVDPGFRSVPHSVEAERGVLGSILLDPQEVMPQCLDRIRTPEAFYDNVNQIIWTAIVELFEKKVAIDPITLQQRLKDKGKLEEVGGLVYLVSLPDSVPSAANISTYLDILLDKLLFRASLKECIRLSDLAYEWSDSADRYLDVVQQGLNELAVHRHVSTIVPVRYVVHEIIEDTQASLEREADIDGIPTGFPDLDRITWGMHPGEMIILAARSSSGKSSLAMNIVDHVAVNLKIPVGVFSLEMKRKALVHRMICARAGVNGRRIRVNPERDMPKFTKAAGQIAAAPIHIDEARGCNSLQIRARARRMQKNHGCGLFVIDYLNLVESPRKRDKRNVEVADVSRDLYALAGELNVPVIGLTQLNREMDKDKGRRPRISDLYESGSMENDCDQAWLLYQKEQKGETGAQDYGEYVITPAGLIIAKQRAGETTEISLQFVKSWTKFVSAAKDSPAEQTEMPVGDQ